MMRKMLETVKGSPDGINVRTFREGKEYDLPEKLANAFDAMGVCEVCEKNNSPVKSAGASPTNKMVEPKADKTDESKKKDKPQKSADSKPKRRRNN